MDKKMLPVGLDSFEKIRRLGYYYMDKTLLIQRCTDQPRRREPVHPSPPVWQDAEYEHALELL